MACMRALPGRAKTVGLALPVVLLAGCGTNQYLLSPSAVAGAPPSTAQYQQAVELHYHALTQNLDQAINSEEVALSQDPRYAPGYVRLGGLFLMAGETSGAIAALKDACSLAPRNAVDWVILGQAEARVGQPRQAALAYQRALHVNPGAWKAWDGLGFLAVSQHAYRTAWKDGQTALLAAGEEGPTLDLMGRVLLSEGDASDALTYFTDAEEVQPGWWQSYNDAGRANLALGDASDALQNFRQAVSLNPTDASAWAHVNAIEAKRGAAWKGQ